MLPIIWPRVGAGVAAHAMGMQHALRPMHHLHRILLKEGTRRECQPRIAGFMDSESCPITR